jgi:hypothetical protein
MLLAGLDQGGGRRQPARVRRTRGQRCLCDERIAVGGGGAVDQRAEDPGVALAYSGGDPRR